MKTIYTPRNFVSHQLPELVYFLKECPHGWGLGEGQVLMSLPIVALNPRIKVLPMFFDTTPVTK